RAAKIGEADLREDDGGAGLALVLLGIVAGQPRQNDIPQSLPWWENVVLRQVAQARAAPQGTRAGVGIVEAGDQAQQGSFARAIGHAQPDTLAGAQVKSQIGEEATWTERFGEALYAEEEGHAVSFYGGGRHNTAR